jgi:hypothetical protein
MLNEEPCAYNFSSEDVRMLYKKAGDFTGIIRGYLGRKSMMVVHVGGKNGEVRE